MDTNEHVSSMEDVESSKDVASAWLPVTGALRSPDRAPSPTCPFIKNRQCQRATRQLKADSCWFPDLHRGSRLSVQCWRPMRSGGGSRQRRVGGAHLGGVRDSVNGFLTENIKKGENSNKNNMIEVKNLWFRMAAQRPAERQMDRFALHRTKVPLKTLIHRLNRPVIHLEIRIRFIARHRFCVKLTAKGVLAPCIEAIFTRARLRMAPITKPLNDLAPSK